MYDMYIHIMGICVCVCVCVCMHARACVFPKMIHTHNRYRRKTILESNQ